MCMRLSVCAKSDYRKEKTSTSRNKYICPDIFHYPLCARFDIAHIEENKMVDRIRILNRYNQSVISQESVKKCHDWQIFMTGVMCDHV